MFLSRTRQVNGFRENNFPEQEMKGESLKDVVESLSKALVTLESLEEVELVQLLKMHLQYFPDNGIDFYKITRRYEKSLIEHALKRTNGSQTKAAKLLNLRLTTLNAMIKRHKIRT